MPPARSHRAEVAVSPSPELVEPGVLVRVPATDRTWVSTLPAVPYERTLTVTVGRPELLPAPTDEVVATGYRVVGAASAQRPIGDCIDVLVPEGLRLSAPGWWSQLLALAERVFDLRHGPVQEVLAPELAMHRQGPSS